jgi:hypothetical protein
MIGEELNVRGYIFFPFSGDVVTRKDSVDGAGGEARIAVHTFLRMDEELVLSLVDAVHRALVDAGAVLHANTGLADHIRHISSFWSSLGGWCLLKISLSAVSMWPLTWAYD